MHPLVLLNSNYFLNLFLWKPEKDEAITDFNSFRCQITPVAKCYEISSGNKLRIEYHYWYRAVVSGPDSSVLYAYLPASARHLRTRFRDTVSQSQRDICVSKRNGPIVSIV
jgi:hypothetical protein